jgi:hypothetical protein
MKDEETVDVTPGTGDAESDGDNFFGAFFNEEDGEEGLEAEEVEEDPEDLEEDEDLSEDEPEDDEDEAEDEDDPEEEEEEDEPEDEPEEDEIVEEDKPTKKTKKTKEAEPESLSLEDTLVDFVENGVLDVLDEEKEYTPDNDGFKELVTDTVEARVKAKEDERLAKQDPRVAELDQYLQENPEGDISTWAQDQDQTDYNEVDHTNPEYAAYLIEDDLTLRGYPEDEIADTIEGYKRDKSLGRHALRAKQTLIKKQAADNEAKSAARSAAEQQRKSAIVEQQRKFEQKVLKTEKIAGFKIDPKERQELADYIMKPLDDQGNTQLMLDEANNGESDLLYAFIQKRKLNLSKLQRKATTKAAINFKRKIDKHTDKSAKKLPNRAEEHPDQGQDNGEIDDSVLGTWNM